MKNLKDLKLAIIGLGYVGLPLAVEFGRKRPVVGFDINSKRIEDLKQGKDVTRETTKEKLKAAVHLKYTDNPQELKSCNCFIVTVPTPIDNHKRPDLTMLRQASETVGKSLKKGDFVVYESTVYPGVTEEECVPIIEQISGLKFNQDFFWGYSPERINPGDPSHRITEIKKITSGSTPESAELIDALYKEIITAGTHKAESIRAMVKNKIRIEESKVLILGLDFKENCPDIRNTRVVDIVRDFQDLNCHVDVYDLWVSEEDALKELGAAAIRTLGKSQHILYDLKYVLPPEFSDIRL